MVILLHRGKESIVGLALLYIVHLSSEDVEVDLRIHTKDLSNEAPLLLVGLRYNTVR